MPIAVNRHPLADSTLPKVPVSCEGRQLVSELNGILLFLPSAACYRGVATQCWRCFTPSPGSTPSFPCCQPACWMSAAPPHRFSSACWLPVYHSCWSFLSRRSVGDRACKMCALYIFFNLNHATWAFRGPSVASLSTGTTKKALTSLLIAKSVTVSLPSGLPGAHRGSLRRQVCRSGVYTFQFVMRSMGVVPVLGWLCLHLFLLCMWNVWWVIELLCPRSLCMLSLWWHVMSWNCPNKLIYVHSQTDRQQETVLFFKVCLYIYLVTAPGCIFLNKVMGFMLALPVTAGRRRLHPAQQTAGSTAADPGGEGRHPEPSGWRWKRRSAVVTCQQGSTRGNFNQPLPHLGQQADLSSLVSEGFVRFFVELVGHYGLHMVESSNGSRELQRDSFRKSHPSRGVRQFLQLFMDTQMFAGFIQDKELAKGGARGTRHSSWVFNAFLQNQ